MAIKKLTSKSFINQMWRYGLFSENIPPCFDSTQFASKCAELNKHVSKTYATVPATLSIYKNDTSRRSISVPNPYAFARTVNFMSEHRNDLFSFAYSKNSESPITFIHRYGNEEEETVNSDFARTFLRAKSEFRSNMRHRIVLAMGYKYRLSIDIASFYETIYTHSISWAICGKEEAKRIFWKQQKRTKEYDFSDGLDKVMMNQKDQETNGILTGPFTSRIFSELILASIDKELQEEKYVFTRCVDDFKFYFRSDFEARRAVIKIAKILGKYNLAINQSKTEILEYPFDVESPMREMLEDAKNKTGVYGALCEASRLYINGEKGAYKYALKLLKNDDIPEEDREVVLSMLFNINLINPKYATFITSYLKQSKLVIGDERLSEIINDELERSLDESFEQEVLNLLFFLRNLHLHVKGASLLKALKIRNDFIDIVALDYWINEKSLVDRSPYEASLLNKEVSKLESDLLDQSMDAEHWLLLYESKMHNLLNVSIQKGKTAPFFAEMQKLRISFYHAS